ncbi:hypothetical protein AKJ09_01631 [Labilithrix luteola]|uniref:Uncharacterized protein n=1 Tax=Labilithrix luteola TaxID=1391654 RepID=A0A0K1PN76_9BACT|nr:hypothetical protein [Labilithrix luteola]AKU94967.1 hypothetical protein AKJ09_01631 [Labilithrix luteola]
MAFPSSRRAACAIVAALLLLAVDAGATEPLDITMTYEAPGECPSRAALEEELRARVKTSWLGRSDARTFDVEITRLAGGGYGGRLAIAQPNEAPSVREIRATSCREAVRSVAVFIALALEPASEPVPPNPTSGAPIETPKPDEAPPPVVPLPVRPERPHASPPPPSPRAAPPSPLWIWSAGYELTYLHAPQAAWGGRVHAELAHRRGTFPIAPALRVSWGFRTSRRFPKTPGRRSFS